MNIFQNKITKRNLNVWNDKHAISALDVFEKIPFDSREKFITDY